jgi:hypothetical protein
MTKPLDLERFKALLAAYGARPERFPAAEREAALALLAASDEARALARAESMLDDAFVEAPRAELSPLLARRLAELPVRHARPERQSRFVTLWTALGWSAAAAVGVVWGARTEALDQANEPKAETASATSADQELEIDDEELVELALGAVAEGEEEP